MGNDTIRFSITSGNQGDVFKIHETTGQISVNDASELDYEDTKKYTLLIKATDMEGASNGLEDEASVVINVRDSNEAPTLKKKKTASGEEIDLVERDIEEDSEAESKVGDELVCEEEDKSDQSQAGKCIATCRIVKHKKTQNGAEETEEYFTIDENRQIKVKPGKTAPSYSVLSAVFVDVECEDTGGKIGSDTVKININEKNNAPNIAVKNFTIYEDAKKGLQVGSKLTASDQEVDEGSQSLTWSITAGNSKNIFSIDSSTGQLKIKSTKELDYEELENTTSKNAKITLTVKVEDNDAKSPASDTEDIKITILDVNEKPELDADDFTGSVKEDAKKATKIGDPLEDFDEVDPENKTLTYKIVKGNDDGLFAVSETTGQITLEKSYSLDYETKKEYEITVRIYEEEPEASVDYRGNTHTTTGG